MAACTSLPSKLVRAVRWYLIQQGFGGDQVFHHFDYRERKFVADKAGKPQRIIDVLLRPIGPDVVFTGNDDFILEIQISASVGDQLNPIDAEQLRADMDADVGAVREALMQSDDNGQTFAATYKAINAAAYTMPAVPPNADDYQTKFAALNADMDDFTILSWVNDVYGVARFDKTVSMVTMRFKCSACETKLTGYV